MKLVKMEVQRYRSFVDQVTVDFADGFNVIVGRNNTGKSNLFGALALALDPASTCLPEQDHPAQMRAAVPRIVLEFELSRQAPDQTLKRHLQEYEEGVGAKPSHTLASRGLVRLTVEFRGGTRQEYFQAGSTGARRLSAGDERHVRALKQFRKVVRFVMIRSGEDLESVLAGRFRDILQLAIRDHLGHEVEQAEKARRAYLEALQDTPLNPLQSRLDAVVSRLFPDITESQLLPHVPQLDRTLAEMLVHLKDSALTDLRGKGTGVRGGVLLALLRYLAEESRRSIILAVEEPESFPHPGAQEALRSGLEDLASRSDVTLLATTHSPFLLSSAPSSKGICLRKTGQGYTELATDDPVAARSFAHVELFRDAAVGALLDEATQFSLGDHEAVLLVVGTTDEAYLRTAARLTNRVATLNRFKISPCGGAEKAALQAIVLSHRAPAPIFLVSDADDIGRASMKKLEALMSWTPKKQMMTLAAHAWVPGTQNVEAEDLWPPALMHRCVEAMGEGGIDGFRRIKSTGERRYEFNKDGKDVIAGLVEDFAVAEDCGRWAAVLDELVTRLDRELRGGARRTM